MDISPYFAEMIAQKDQVIVPGLGKFFKKRSEGYYDAETKTFYPPSGKIDFSSEYMHDDRLVQHISQKGNISLTSAYSALDEYVRDLKNILKGSPVVLEGIGKLQMVDEKISLETDDNPNLNKAFFGLPTIDIEAASFQGNDNEQYSLAQQALNTAVVDDEDDFEKAHKKSNLLKILLLFIAFTMISVLIALYSIRPDLYQNIAKYFRKESPVEAKSTDDKSLKTADSIYNSKLSTEEKLKNMGFDVEKVRDSTDVAIDQNNVPNTNNIRYEIIIGQYPKQEQAEERVKQLKSYGINSYVVTDADGPLVKISAGAFYDETEAKRELKRIQEDLNPQAFIKPIKNLK
ncbi:MAG: SPOR domain-containing protein [Bacteroidetes bacterium]|nr:SPOR domain-containing protein [Bacteroidota bacterium]MBU1484571.1 SPOR domain-containing protein [Bacteroidota bacterium]MBU2267692.1 SPOR domain-containing protein [Bacteroidota bacterium]MBU2376841.1 SPOR domain-containing protein [Bacteroidota bacterium]